MGVGATGSGSGSRWVGPGSANQTDAQTVDLTLMWMSGLTGSGGSLCFYVYCQRGRYESDGLYQFESGGFKCLWLVRIPEINFSL